MKTKLFVAVFLAALVGFSSCSRKKDPPLSKACDIISITGTNGTWSNSGSDYTGIYCKSTNITSLSPTITVSEKATHNFSGPKDLTDWVTVTVTAENKKDTKTYRIKADTNQTACP